MVPAACTPPTAHGVCELRSRQPETGQLSVVSHRDHADACRCHSVDKPIRVSSCLAKPMAFVAQRRRFLWMKRDWIHASVLMTRSRGLLYLLPRQALDRPAVNFTRAPGNLSCPFSPSGLWCWRLTCCKKSGCKVEPLVLRQRQRKLQDVLRVWTHLGHRSSTGAVALECTCVYRTSTSQHLQARAASPLGLQTSNRTRSVRTTGVTGLPWACHAVTSCPPTRPLQ